MKRRALVNLSRECLKRLMEDTVRQYYAEKYWHENPPFSVITEATNEASQAVNSMDDNEVLSWTESLFSREAELTYEEDASGQYYFSLV